MPTPGTGAVPADNPSYRLLLRAHSPPTAARIFTEHIAHNKPLFLRPSSPPAGQDNPRAQRQAARKAKAAARRKSSKPRPLSAKQKRVLGVYELPKEQRKYEIFVPLWRMWCAYVREVLFGVRPKKAGEDGGEGNVSVAPAPAFVTPAGAGPLLASADFHGAELTVVRSRCVGRVGTRGIVVRDTKFTYDLITEKNELKSELSGMGSRAW